MIRSYEWAKKEIGEIGEVIETTESFVKCSDLGKATIGEVVSFEGGRHGQILALRKDYVEVLVFSRHPISVGTKVARTNSKVTVSLGEGLMGHTIDTFGYAKDERRFKSDFPEEREINTMPIGIVGRKQIKRFMSTGIALVDLMLPIGWGQRELIIGDRKTGKSHFLLQTVLNQTRLGRVCIYGAIGKRKEEIRAVEDFFQKHGIEDRTVIVAADSYDSPGEVYLAPYTAMTVAEYFRDKGIDVLLILDDLTTHAKYYRELSLISRRFPGRESYPGDVFHIHSKLLERAGCFEKDGKESTITCLPVAESVGADFTGYIQTNLMSITDGHIYFDTEYFLKGLKPAINPFLSVTRVGRQTQTPLMRDVGQKVTYLLKKHSNLQRFLSFGQELGEEAKASLVLGDTMLKFLTQTGYAVYTVDLQLMLTALLWLGLWNGEGGNKIAEKYQADIKMQETVQPIIAEVKTLEDLCAKIKVKSNLILNKLG